MKDKRIKGDDPTPRQHVQSLLPEHYEVRETMSGMISCISRDGIEDEGKWANFFESIKKYFGDSFKEVYHSTCTYHLNFTVYYDYYKLYNLTFDKQGGNKLKH